MIIGRFIYQTNKDSKGLNRRYYLFKWFNLSDYLPTLDCTTTRLFNKAVSLQKFKKHNSNIYQ